MHGTLLAIKEILKCQLNEGISNEFISVSLMNLGPYKKRITGNEVDKYPQKPQGHEGPLLCWGGCWGTS